MEFIFRKGNDVPQTLINLDRSNFFLSNNLFLQRRSPLGELEDLGGTDMNYEGTDNAGIS